MKKTLRYAAYHFKNTTDNENIIFDIRPLLKSYSENGTLKLKSSFEKSGEKLYLLPAEEEVMDRNRHYTPSLYYFIKTKDQEIIRKIDKEELTVSDIKEKLRADESIAFAAYVYFTEKLICFIPTIYSPTLNELHQYFEQLFVYLKAPVSMHLTIMAEQTSIHEALTLDFIGRSTIEIASENKLFSGIIEALQNFGSGGANNLDTSCLGSIEITFKPTRKGNIKGIVMPLLSENHLNDVEKFNLRAKEDLEDRLSDYYIMSKGALSDLIDLNGNGGISQSIMDALNENEQLANRLLEWENEGNKTYKDSWSLSIYSSHDFWNNFNIGI